MSQMNENIFPFEGDMIWELIKQHMKIKLTWIKKKSMKYETAA